MPPATKVPAVPTAPPVATHDKHRLHKGAFQFHERLKDVSAEYLFHSVTTANKTYDLKTYNFAKLSKLVDWMDVFSAQFTLGPGGFVVVSPLVQGWKALNEATRDETRVEARAWEVMEQRGRAGTATEPAAGHRSNGPLYKIRIRYFASGTLGNPSVTLLSAF